MAFDPKLKAIPTTYRGRRYRSRLEARWACMFDLLGWRYEYEPYDLGGWIPDFEIFAYPEDVLGLQRSQYGCRFGDEARRDEGSDVRSWDTPRNLLVEVKPYSSKAEFWDGGAIEKIGHQPGKEILLLGCALPSPELFPAIGWLGQSAIDPDGSWGGCGPYYGWCPDPRDEGWWYGFGQATLTAHGRLFDIAHSWGWYTHRLSGKSLETTFTRNYKGYICPDLLSKLWAEAGNEVQWKAVR